MLWDIPSCLGRRERWQRPVTCPRAHIASSKVESSSTILRAFWFCLHFTCGTTGLRETPSRYAEWLESVFYPLHFNPPPLSVPQGWCRQHGQHSPLSPGAQTLRSYCLLPLPAGWAAPPPERRCWEHGRWCELLSDESAWGREGVRFLTGWKSNEERI